MDILGLAEVAALFGVSPQAVANWRRRRADFPRPYAELRMGPVWLGQRDELTAWAARRDDPTPAMTDIPPVDARRPGFTIDPWPDDHRISDTPPADAQPDWNGWLIERGQPEKQRPTVWWADRKRWGLMYSDSWTTDAFKAYRFDSKEAAEQVIYQKFTPPVGEPTARAVAHGFVQPAEPLTAEQITEERHAARAEDGLLVTLDEIAAVLNEVPFGTAHGWFTPGQLNSQQAHRLAGLMGGFITRKRAALHATPPPPEEQGHE